MCRAFRKSCSSFRPGKRIEDDGFAKQLDRFDQLLAEAVDREHLTTEPPISEGNGPSGESPIPLHPRAR